MDEEPVRLNHVDRAAGKIDPVLTSDLGCAEIANQRHGRREFPQLSRHAGRTLFLQRDPLGADGESKAEFFSGFGEMSVDTLGMMRPAGH